MTDLRTILDEDLSDVSIEAEIACVRRELDMRANVYARRVTNGQMSQAEADREIRRMRKVLQRLLKAEQTGSLL